MRLSKLRTPPCGTDRTVVEGLGIVTREVPVEDGAGNEPLFREDERHPCVRPHEAGSHGRPHCGKRRPGCDRSDEGARRTVDLGTPRRRPRHAPVRADRPGHGVVTEAVSRADPGARDTGPPDGRVAWAMCRLCQGATRGPTRVGASTVASACRRVPDGVVDRGALLDGAAGHSIGDCGVYSLMRGHRR